jgi:hypothetical protein
MVVAVGLLGVLGVQVFARVQADKLVAFAGVALATLSGAAALSLKRWALARSVRSVLGMVGVMFCLRLGLVVAGLAYVRVKGASVVPFVVGFFAVYFVIQWVEISYVLAESRRLGTGGF